MNLLELIKSEKFGINSFTLKIIAAVTMLIDHVGYIFFPQYIFLRIIGRISFPIFAFLVVEGFMHTKDIRKYMIRLLLFAIISEIPFDFAFFGEINWLHQNVIFTFLLAILAMYIDKTYEIIAGIGATVGLGLVAEYIGCDYGMFGVILIMIFYWNYRHFISKLVIGTGALTLLVQGIQRLDVLAMIPIVLYNGKKGISVKYFFYIFYPGHLLVLYIIHTLIG